MHLGFIGMSGAGKSYWGMRLSEVGFHVLHCDDLIAARLRAELDQPLLTLTEVGDWMGLPYEAGYAEREARYLAHEQAVMQEILEQLRQHNAAGESFVVDMTGSAVYMDAALLAALRQYLTVVYFAVSDQVHTQMLQAYIAAPRPVVWQGLYQPRSGESPSETLARCYPQLIATRETLYEAWCDVKLSYAQHRQPDLTAEEFLCMVAQKT